MFRGKNVPHNKSFEKSKTPATQAEAKKPQSRILNLTLENGSTLSLIERYRWINSVTSRTYYVDEKTGKSYIVKNSANLQKEYLGSVAFQELRINVPDFFLALYPFENGQNQVVFMQELLEDSHLVDLYSSAHAKNIKYEMAFIVAAMVLLGDSSGSFLDSKSIKIINGKLYKIDNAGIFQHVIDDPYLIVTKLFDPELCQQKELSKIVAYLTRSDFEGYTKIIRQFFSEFNGKKFKKKLMEAYNHPFLKDFTRTLPETTLNKVFHQIADTVQRFPSLMRAKLTSLRKAEEVLSLDDVAPEIDQMPESPFPAQVWEQSQPVAPEFYQPFMPPMHSGYFQQSVPVFPSPFYDDYQWCQSQALGYSEDPALFAMGYYPDSSQDQWVAPVSMHYDTNQPQSSFYHDQRFIPPKPAAFAHLPSIFDPQPYSELVEYKAHPPQTTIQQIQETLQNVKDDTQQQLQGMQETMGCIMQKLQQLEPKTQSKRLNVVKRNEQPREPKQQMNQQPHARQQHRAASIEKKDDDRLRARFTQVSQADVSGVPASLFSRHSRQGRNTRHAASQGAPAATHRESRNGQQRRVG